MTIASEITRINNNIASAYTAVNNKGGTLPATQNSANLATAINSIPSGITPILITKTITQNGTYNASSDNADGYSSVTVNVSGGGGYEELPSYQVSSGVANRRSGALTGNEFSNITSISNNGLSYAFYNCSGLTGNLNLSLLTNIGNFGLSYAFVNCSGLTGVDLSSLTSVDRYGLSYAFNSCSGLTSVDLSSLTSVGDYGFSYAFLGCYGLTGNLDLSSLTSIGEGGFDSAFYRCFGLTSVDLSSLTSISDSGFASAFNSCSGLTSVDLSSLTSISDYGFNNIFTGCSGLTSVNLSSLTSVGLAGLFRAFQSCTGLTDVYFNSLTTTSFGSYKNQFNYMLSSTGTSVTHTLHFPSNLQSTISGLTGYPTFGGTSGYVVCAFDLPATS